MATKKRCRNEKSHLERAKEHSYRYMNSPNAQDLEAVKYWMDKASEEEPKTIPLLTFIKENSLVPWPVVLHYPASKISSDVLQLYVNEEKERAEVILVLLQQCWPKQARTLLLSWKNNQKDNTEPQSIDISFYAPVLRSTTITGLQIDSEHRLTGTGTFPNILWFSDVSRNYSLSKLAEWFPNLETPPTCIVSHELAYEIHKYLPNIKFATNGMQPAYTGLQNLQYIYHRYSRWNCYPDIRYPNIQQTLRVLDLDDISDWDRELLDTLRALAGCPEFRQLKLKHMHSFQHMPNATFKSRFLNGLRSLKQLQCLTVCHLELSIFELQDLLGNPPESLVKLIWFDFVTYGSNRHVKTLPIHIQYQVATITAYWESQRESIHYQKPFAREHHRYWCKVAFLISWYRANRTSCFASSGLCLAKWLFHLYRDLEEPLLLQII